MAWHDTVEKRSDKAILWRVVQKAGNEFGLWITVNMIVVGFRMEINDEY